MRGCGLRAEEALAVCKTAARVMELPETFTPHSSVLRYLSPLSGYPPGIQPAGGRGEGLNLRVTVSGLLRERNIIPTGQEAS